MRERGVMDVAPPWYELSHALCSGERRLCGGGDTACRQKAEKDGYVAISPYAFCRQEEVYTIPRPAGAFLFVGVVAALAVVVRRLRRARSR